MKILSETPSALLAISSSAGLIQFFIEILDHLVTSDLPFCVTSTGKLPVNEAVTASAVGPAGIGACEGFVPPCSSALPKPLKGWSVLEGLACDLSSRVGGIVMRIPSSSTQLPTLANQQMFAF
jgi:hypothetical protein